METTNHFEKENYNVDVKYLASGSSSSAFQFDAAPTFLFIAEMERLAVGKPLQERIQAAMDFLNRKRITLAEYIDQF